MKTPAETWAATLASPRALKGRIVRFGRALSRPASWPMAVKMTIAMVATGACAR
jgi:hypothetical protein